MIVIARFLGVFSLISAVFIFGNRYYFPQEILPWVFIFGGVSLLLLSLFVERRKLGKDPLKVMNILERKRLLPINYCFLLLLIAVIGIITSTLRFISSGNVRISILDLLILFLFISFQYSRGIFFLLRKIHRQCQKRVPQKK